MKYAVIKSGGNQYKVSEGEELLVDNLNIEDGKPVKFEEVLLLVEDEKVKIGKPLVEGLSIEGKSMGLVKGEKVRVAKFKAKSRYDRVIGFRHQFTRVKIGKFGTETVDAKTPSKPRKTAKKQ